MVLTLLLLLLMVVVVLRLLCRGLHLLLASSQTKCH